MAPRVSVIIPTYNRARLLPEAIDSVLAQTYGDHEIIVVDDGSTDNTLSLLEQYGKQITLLRQENRGYGGSYARNLGIQHARGALIGFLDSDDRWLPHKLEAQVAALDHDPNLMWVYCDCEFFDSKSGAKLYRQSRQHQLRQGDILQPLFVRNFIPSVTPLVRREVFNYVGLFWPTPKATDWDMWLRIASRFPVGLTPDVLAQMRIHAEQLTSDITGERSMQSTLSVMRRAVLRDPERLAPYEAQATANLYLAAGMLLARQARLRDARRLFREARRATPTEWKPMLFWLSTFVGPAGMRVAVNARRRIRAWRSR